MRILPLKTSYIPEADPDTGEIDPADLPDTLPGYLINLTAEFSENDTVVETAAAGKMGGELYETLVLWSPSQGWDQAVNHPIVGEYRAIGLDLQGANAEEAAKLQAQIEETKAILEEEYINNQNPDATVGDVLGTHKVIIQEHQQLAAGLPYELVARTNNYSTLPGSLRHKFRYTLGTEYYGSENSRLITFEKSLPELAGHKLSLSLKPSSEDDEAVIASYIPEADPDTGEIDPADLPDTLPGYLINLTAEFSENDTVVETAAAGKMGGELYETLALWSPS